jgi:hypothetical protein
VARDAVTLDDHCVIDALTTDDEIERSSFIRSTIPSGILAHGTEPHLGATGSRKGLNTDVLIDHLREGGLVNEDTLAMIRIGLIATSPRTM